MVSRRNFISIAAIMLVIFFMFQFSSVALEIWNDYGDNKHVVDVGELAERSSAFGADPAGISEATPWGTARPQVVFIGEAGSSVGAVVDAWTSYSKRELVVAEDLVSYTPGQRTPELIVLDGARLQWNTSTCLKLMDCAAQGSSIVFATLPDASVIRDVTVLRDLLGIKEVREDRTTVTELSMYKGFLLGGEVTYKAEEPQQDAWRQDLDMSMPWYVLGTGTKVYMKGTPAEGDAPVEEHPSSIWRHSLGGSYVFAVNGDYMTDVTGLGILSAISFERDTYSVYPVVNAQNLIIANYPGLATENGQELGRYYSGSMRGVYRDILWPDITSIYIRGKLGLSCMMAMQFDYLDGALPDAGQFIYYMKLINELQGETGLSGVQVSDIPITNKLVEDFTFMENSQLEYQFTSFYAGDLDEQDVTNALGWEDLASVRTVVRPYDGSPHLIGYETDRVTRQMSLVDGFRHTNRSDLRMRSVETALAYTSILVDALPSVYPEYVEETWGMTAQHLSTDVPHKWEAFNSFDGTTVSECDGRIRSFLTMDYTSSFDGEAVQINHTGSNPVWFILRTNHRAVDKVEGGSALPLEDGTFLIEAREQEVTVTLQVAHDAPA